MQIRRGGRQKKVNAKSLNLFYNLFCMFTTIFRSPYSRAATFIDRLIMLFSAVPAKCGDKRGGGGFEARGPSTWISWEHQKDGGLKK